MENLIRKPTEIENKYLQIPRIIYHYTSPDGLINIVDKGELWFSRFDCLNDTSEGTYIQEIYSRSIRKLLQNKEVDEDFLLKLEDVKPDYLRFFKLYGEKETANGKGVQAVHGFLRTTKPYLCCFSTDQDSLPMWNYYSKGNRYEGYNFGFHYEETIKAHKNIDVVKVIYNENDQVTIITDAVKNAYYDYEKFNHSIGICRGDIASILSSRSIQFKNKAFSHEKEVRLVYWEPEDTNDIEFNKETMNYRQKNGIIIPYLKIMFSKEQIKSLRIGPLIQKDVAEESAREMFASKGFYNIKIDHSNIPIRY